jgi:hypothetical protein
MKNESCVKVTVIEPFWRYRGNVQHVITDMTPEEILSRLLSLMPLVEMIEENIRGLSKLAERF